MPDRSRERKALCWHFTWGVTQNRLLFNKRGGSRRTDTYPLNRFGDQKSEVKVLARPHSENSEVPSCLFDFWGSLGLWPYPSHLPGCRLLFSYKGTHPWI